MHRTAAAMELAASFPEGDRLLKQQRKPRVVFRFAAEGYHIVTRYIKDFIRYGPSSARNASSFTY
jgi:hypothetical protein